MDHRAERHRPVSAYFGRFDTTVPAVRAYCLRRVVQVTTFAALVDNEAPLKPAPIVLDVVSIDQVSRKGRKDFSIAESRPGALDGQTLPP
jgi:hypothetical protein